LVVVAVVDNIDLLRAELKIDNIEDGREPLGFLAELCHNHWSYLPSLHTSTQ